MEEVLDGEAVPAQVGVEVPAVMEEILKDMAEVMVFSAPFQLRKRNLRCLMMKLKP
jgi:hypothetical protein